MKRPRASVDERRLEILTRIQEKDEIKVEELADEFGFTLLPVSFPVTNRIVLNRGYAGPRGGLTLAEDILGALVAGR